MRLEELLMTQGDQCAPPVVDAIGLIAQRADDGLQALAGARTRMMTQMAALWTLKSTSKMYGSVRVVEGEEEARGGRRSGHSGR